MVEAKLGSYYADSITDCKLIAKKLYGFDGGKQHKFVRFEFEILQPLINVKVLVW